MLVLRMYLAIWGKFLEVLRQFDNFRYVLVTKLAVEGTKLATWRINLAILKTNLTVIGRNMTIIATNLIYSVIDDFVWVTDEFGEHYVYCGGLKERGGKCLGRIWRPPWRIGRVGESLFDYRVHIISKSSVKSCFKLSKIILSLRTSLMMNMAM